MSELAFDIETVEDESVLPLLEEPKAPANYRDQAKIDAYIAEKKADRKLALDPACCRIVCVGAATPRLNGGAPFTMVCRNEDDERQALEFLVTEMGFPGTRVVGFNILSFDLPVTIQRCRLLGITPPQISLNKYHPSQVADLAQMLCFQGAHQMRSLKFWAKRFKIPVQDTLAGSDIGGLVAAGEWDMVAHHCQSDVELTVELAKRLGVVSYPEVLEDASIPF